MTVTAAPAPQPTVTVTVTPTPKETQANDTTEAAAPSDSSTPQATTASATSGGVDYGVAATTCDSALDQSAATSGFKWDGDPIIGMMGGEATGSDTYFAKYTGKLKNAAGGKIHVTVECEVGGTENAPVIVKVNVYDDAGNSY